MKIYTTKTKVFNSEMNLMKTIGIFYIVVGHINSKLVSIIRQPYTFHIPLFYFISGYFYNEVNEVEKAKYIWSKLKRNVGLFYVYYVAFMVVATLFWWKYRLNLGTVSPYTVFIMPFTLGVGNPGFFMGPAWFILSLFLVQTLFILIYPLVKKYINSEFIRWLFFLFLGALSIHLSNKGWTGNEYLLMITRTLIGMMFYYFGHFYKVNIENKIPIFNGKYLVLMTILISYIMAVFPTVVVGIGSGSYSDYIFLPIVVSIIGIYISIFTAKALDKLIINKNDILHKIGRNSFYVMILHAFVFFLISFAYFIISKTPNHNYSALSIFPFCPSVINLDKFWPLYISLGLLLPTFYGECVGKLKTMFIANVKLKQGISNKRI